MEKINILDESGDKNYFTIIPNYIANHSTANDQALYFQMKRYAGDNGRCFATTETLMKQLGIGRKALNKSIDYLCSHKWIDFVGMTGGKTRPIKTYKVNDIWKMNNEYYEKIKSERTLSFKGDRDQKEKDTAQKNTKIPTERTVEEEPYKEELINTRNASVSRDIEQVIYAFKEINPSYKKWFGNRTQRGAAERLLNTHGLDLVLKYIEALKLTNSQPYAPTVTTPVQLEDKLGALKAWSDKRRNKVETPKYKPIKIIEV